MILAVLMSWAGWAWLDHVPVALALSQLPAAVIVLAWVAEHAHQIPMPARRQTVLASPAALAVQAAEHVLTAAAQRLDQQAP